MIADNEEGKLSSEL